jgi:hypothetical protein
MHTTNRIRRGAITRSALGPSAAEAFVIIAIATILITRLYLDLTGYPQIGGGDLHIAHALYGGALMMLALIIGWMALGFGARAACVVMGGIGFGLFLDEVGKFVTKDNDYFYGPSAEIMYILVVVILVGARVVRDFRPLSAQECLASAAGIAADGVARRVRELLEAADPAPDRLRRLQHGALALIPNVFRSPRWVPVVGWLLVLGSFFTASLGALGAALGGYFYEHEHVSVALDGLNIASVILFASAVLTLGIALPAMVVRRRTNAVWPLRWLRNAALIFTLLNALVDFATEGFAALIALSIGLFAMAILSYQLDRETVASYTADK